MKRETLHRKLMTHNQPVNKAAGLAIAKPSIDDRWVPELDPEASAIESDTFLPSYSFEEWLTSRSPVERKQIRSIDRAGERYGRLTVIGVYIDPKEWPINTPADIRYKQFQSTDNRCPTCQQKLNQYKNPGRLYPTKPKLRWTCKCDCGNYVVRSAKAVAKKVNDEECCSACEKVEHSKWLHEQSVKELNG